MSKPRKIVSGKNITVFIGGEPRMFIGGDSNNEYFFQFLKSCEDEEKLNLVLNNRMYENYIKSYNMFPLEGEEVFEHGHKISYLATDSTFKFNFQYNNSSVNILALKIANVSESAIPHVQYSENEAIKYFKSNNDEFEPQKILTVCDKCKTLYAIKDLNTEVTKTFSKEKIVNV